MSFDLSQLRRLGMDEISLRKGQGDYVVVLVDLDKNELIGLVESRQGKRISNPIDTTVLGFIQNAKKFKSTTLGRRVGLTFWLLCGRNL